MNRVVAIIPARGGSKSVPKKNIRLLGKYPLIAYSIAAAKLSKHIEQVIVSTDADDIAHIAEVYGADVPFRRPLEIAQDHSTDMEFFEHFIRFCNTEGIVLPEYMVHLRPTTPLRELSVVDSAIEKILNSPNATGLRSVEAFNVSPYKIFRMEAGYLTGFFPDLEESEYYNLPRQHFPQTFKPNGYVDVVRSSTIFGGKLHGDKLLGVITDAVPDIDAVEDFDQAALEVNEPRYAPLIEFLERRCVRAGT